jgi:hypothetical protein
LQGGLGASDRTRVGEYLDGIREIERRIQKAEQQASAQTDIPEAPVGVPEAFEEHLKLMFDLQALAYKAEITRVSTLMYARDTSGATHPGSGVRDGFHGSVASFERTVKDGHVRTDQQVSSADAGILPRLAESHAGRRRHAAGPFADLYGSSMN